MKKNFLSILTLLLMAVPAAIQAQEAYAVEQDGTLTFYYDGNRRSRGGTLYDVETALAKYHYEKPRWCSSKITKAVFDDTFANYTFENATYMFSGCTNLTEVENMKALNASEITDLGYMFENCGKLASVDMKGLNISKVKSMDGMFYRCASLKSIDLSGLDTKSLKSMFSTFSNSGLEAICLDGLNTSGVTSFNGLFSSCSALTEVDLSDFDTSAATDMSSMFSMCSNLKTIYVGDNWNITHVTSGRSMFFFCSNLVGANGTRCDGFINVDSNWAYIDSETTPGYLTYKASSAPSEAYAVADGGILTFYYDGNKEKRTGTTYNIEEAYVGDGVFPAWRGTSFTKVIFDSSFAAYQPTSTARWFHSCSAITAFEGMENLNTSQATSMSSMFYGCKGLKSLDLSAMNTSSATTMATMFYECSGLESLDLSSFDTHNVKAMTAMFYGCSGLNHINVSSFDTGNVEDMQYMFFNCTALTIINTGRFNTAKVTNMECMFANCEKAIIINIGSFNTAKVENMYRMFYNDQQLTTIYAGNEWSTASIINGGFMFVWCTSLVGGNGTACSGFMNYDYDYARIDGNGGPGYFTDVITIGIADISMSGHEDTGYPYSIDGRRMIPKKGIYIKNGRKVLRK